LDQTHWRHAIALSGDVTPKFQLEIDIEDRKLKVEARSNPDENATKKLEIKIHGTSER